MFLAAERVIRRADTMGVTVNRVSPTCLSHGLLLVTMLGQGRTDLNNKFNALVHHTWLEYGADVVTVRQANADVR